MLVILGLISGCTGLHIRTDNWGEGLSEMAQDKARGDCRVYTGYTEYRDCIAKVNKNYEDWRSQQGRPEENAAPKK